MKIKTSISTNIMVNGKQIDPSQIPDDIKTIIKDEDNNGIPDSVDSILKNVHQPESETEITINGKTYHSWDEVPENQKQFQNTFGQLDKTFQATFKQPEHHEEEANQPQLEPHQQFISKTETHLQSSYQKYLNWALIACVMVLAVALVYQLLKP